jgi:hypothetical protein
MAFFFSWLFFTLTVLNQPNPPPPHSQKATNWVYFPNEEAGCVPGALAEVISYGCASSCCFRYFIHTRAAFFFTWTHGDSPWDLTHGCTLRVLAVYYTHRTAPCILYSAGGPCVTVLREPRAEWRVSLVQSEWVEGKNKWTEVKMKNRENTIE